MFSGRPGANPNAKKPIIRRETHLVPIKRPQNPNGVQKPPANRFKLSERSGVKSKTAALPKKPQAPAQRAIAASRGLKRKSTTPERIQFSSGSEDEDSDIGTSDSDVSRKRRKTSGSPMNSGGAQRELILEDAFENASSLDIIHGADCTSGDQINKFKNPWGAETFETLELQYPSTYPRERFELKWPKNTKDDYKPIDDIKETVMQIADFFFPEELSAKYTSQEPAGFERQFTRAWKEESIEKFKSIVEEFNTVLTPLIQDGTIRRELANKRQLPFDLVKRIGDQIYSRCVSPKVESLRDYQNGTDYVYGELLYRFCSNIFRQVGLQENHVFVDLGSGVGNVVLQAALEVGCESWGIEYMKNPCDLADLQAKEFQSRSKLWGLKVGDVNLLRGDFTENEQIREVLQRADVVLVNNQAFTPSLNDKLRHMFLDLKDGSKVVSLKPFVPDGHKITMRNIGSVANSFVQQKYEYFSKCVSWTDHEGYYYIATKDSGPLERFMKQNRLA